MDPINEAYNKAIKPKQLDEAQKWNIFYFYDETPEQIKEAQALTKKIVETVFAHKFGQSLVLLGQSIGKLIHKNNNVGASDTQSREAIYSYVESVANNRVGDVSKMKF